MTKEKVLEVIIKAMPYPGQITDIEIGREVGVVRFSWRSHRFRVTDDLFVESVDGGMLSGDDCAILLQALLRRTLTLADIEAPPQQEQGVAK